MRTLIASAALTAATVAVGLAITAAPASADPIGPCDLRDQPDAGFDGRTVTLDLRTEVVCFDKSVVVG